MARSRPPRGLFAGALFILLGVWLLLNRLGVALPDWDEMWPIFPLVGGLVFLSGFFFSDRGDPGLVWPGTLSTLVAIFFFFFTFGIVDWSQMSELWPVFPMIAGIAFLATWLAGKGREPGLLVPATLGVGTGVVGLMLTQGMITGHTFQLFWPLVLLMLGLFLVVTSLGRTA